MKNIFFLTFSWLRIPEISSSVDEKENSSQPFEVQVNDMKKAKAAYEEVIIDSSKYYERFMEGRSFVEF